jgi:hypothetical protein
MEPKMNVLTLHILPAPDLRDGFQVRILIDGEEFLDDDSLGLDPPDFCGQNFHYCELLVGICDCGCKGCGDTKVTVTADDKKVVWQTLYQQPPIIYEFERTQYDEAIKAVRNDHSWENAVRRVERLTGEILKDTKVGNGYTFAFATARWKEKSIALYYKKRGKDGVLEEYYEITWDGVNAESGAENAKKFLKTEHSRKPFVF